MKVKDCLKLYDGTDESLSLIAEHITEYHNSLNAKGCNLDEQVAIFDRCVLLWERTVLGLNRADAVNVWANAVFEVSPHWAKVYDIYKRLEKIVQNQE